MVTIDKTKCTGCGACVRDCVGSKIRLVDGKAESDQVCIRCGHCVAICPMNAVSIPEYDMADVETQDENHFGLDPDELLYTIKFRRSIRQYEPRPVGRDVLEYIVEAGRYTATGSNQQGCRFIAVQDGLAEFKEIIWRGVESAEASDAMPDWMLGAMKNFVRMRQTGTDYLFRDAPAVLFIAAESAVDAALAAQNMELAAVAQGLGVLYNGFLMRAAHMNPAARAWLGTEEKPLQVSMLLGYPAVTYERTAPRREADVLWK